jgi:hypothetical protein
VAEGVGIVCWIVGGSHRSFQCTVQFGEQVKLQRAKSGEWGEGWVRALECTYQLKTASPRGHCELAYCLDAESMISSSTVLAFSSHLFSELGQDLQLVLLIDRLTPMYPFNHE